MTQQQTTKPVRLLRTSTVLEKVAMSRTELWRHVKEGNFPKPIKLGARTTVWTEASVDAWIHALEQGANGQH
jgi:prophage regulatory protein